MDDVFRSASLRNLARQLAVRHLRRMQLVLARNCLASTARPDGLVIDFNIRVKRVVLLRPFRHQRVDERGAGTGQGLGEPHQQLRVKTDQRHRLAQQNPIHFHFLTLKPDLFS